MNKIVISDYISPTEMTSICKDKDFTIELQSDNFCGKLTIYLENGILRKAEVEKLQ